jgi:ATP phosphoribosyltransferase regulatory subunit HisZ
MNPKTLQARQPGNRNAVTHDCYSRDPKLSPRAVEIAEGIFEAVSHLAPLHQPLVEELARVLANRERLEVALLDAGFSAKHDWRWELRRGLTRDIDRLSSRLGLTPEAQVRWAAALSQTESVQDALDELRRERETLNNG